MNTVTMVPTESMVRLHASGPLQHLCPFVQEIDRGLVTIGWDTDGWTIELHSLAAYLESFREREISHEDLTEELRAELSGRHGITNVTVETEWNTAGLGVTCAVPGEPLRPGRG